MEPVVWGVHPEVWAAVIGLVGAYFWALRRLGPRHVSPEEAPASRRQQVFFLAGVLLFWAAADGPVHEISERYLFGVHMLQHLIFSFAAAPLMLLGTPEWLWRLILRPAPVRAVFRTLTRPVVALLLFNAYLVVSHLPPYIEATLRNDAFHGASHAAWIAVSVLMWWPVLSPLAEFPRLAAPTRMFYLFLQTIVPTVPASFLTFASTTFYPSYEVAPRLWEITALTDQRVAGVIMKLGAGGFLWTVIAVLFFRWASREEAGVPDTAELQDIERRLNVTGRP